MAALPDVFRLILETAPGRVDTGASYPGCAQNNTAPCIPIQFSTLQDAITYAKDHNEIPVRVTSADEAWQIIAGAKPIQTSQILSTGPSSMMTWLLVGLGAIFLVPKLFKGRR